MGVSYTDIERAAAELQGKGITPTVDTVREVLRTGSRSTIGPYLKQWRHKQAETGHSLGLPAELTAMVKGLYQRLEEAANLEIEAIKQQTMSEIAAIQQKYEAAHTRNLHLEADLKAANQKAVDTQGLADQLKVALENEKTLTSHHIIQIQEQERRLSDRVEHIQLLEKQLNNVQNNLEHYREAMLIQREEEKKAYQRELSLLSQEVHSMRGQLSSVSQACLELGQQLDKSTLEKQKLEKEWYEQRSKTMALQEQLKLKDLTYQAIEKQHAQLSDNYKHLETTLENKIQTIETLQKEQLILQEQLRSVECLLSKSESLIQSLQNERLFLIQENASLKSEFKK